MRVPLFSWRIRPNPLWRQGDRLLIVDEDQLRPAIEACALLTVDPENQPAGALHKVASGYFVT